MHRLVSVLAGVAVGVMVTLGTMLGMATAGTLDEVTAQDRAAIRTVVESQLQAFRVDDGVRAFSYASPGIQAMFQTPARFMRMVRTGYQPVYRPQSVQFGRVIEYQGQPTQLVTLIAPDGDVVAAYYLMERQSDGVWRIDGCVLREAPAI